MSSQQDFGQPRLVEMPEFTAGTLLRHAREAAGLHIGALAVSIKVPVKKLEALEADRFDLLPDVVFARALASTICRNLKVDAMPILERLPQSRIAQLAPRSANINAPFRDTGAPRPSGWAHASRRAMFAGLVLVAGAIVLVLLPALQDGFGKLRNFAASTGLMNGGSPGFAAVSPATGSSQDENAPAGPDGGGVVLSSEPSLKTDPAGGASPSLAGNPVAGVDGESVLSPRDTSAATAAATPASQAVTSGDDVVVFTAKSASWVEVSDAKGKVVLRKMLTPGEAAGASGVLPLVAVVGRADTTSVQVRGKPFALESVTKNNVARFEVK